MGHVFKYECMRMYDTIHTGESVNDLHLVEVVHSPVSSTNVDLKQQDITGHVQVGIRHHLPANMHTGTHARTHTHTHTHTHTRLPALCPGLPG